MLVDLFEEGSEVGDCSDSEAYEAGFFGDEQLEEEKKIEVGSADSAAVEAGAVDLAALVVSMQSAIQTLELQVAVLDTKAELLAESLMLAEERLGEQQKKIELRRLKQVVRKEARDDKLAFEEVLEWDVVAENVVEQQPGLVGQWKTQVGALAMLSTEQGPRVFPSPATPDASWPLEAVGIRSETQAGAEDKEPDGLGVAEVKKKGKKMKKKEELPESPGFRCAAPSDDMKVEQGRKLCKEAEAKKEERPESPGIRCAAPSFDKKVEQGMKLCKEAEASEGEQKGEQRKELTWGPKPRGPDAQVVLDLEEELWARGEFELVRQIRARRLALR